MTERQSDEQGPLVEEELDNEAKSQVESAPLAADADEERVQEGPGEDEVTPDARIADDRELTDEPVAPRDDEVEARTELAHHLEPSDFPATPKALMATARRHHAPDTMVDRLSHLPDGAYPTVEAVWEALGVEQERRSA